MAAGEGALGPSLQARRDSRRKSGRFGRSFLIDRWVVGIQDTKLKKYHALMSSGPGCL